MNLNRFAVSALAVFLGTSGLVTARAFCAPQGPPPPGYVQERGGWDVPPQELSDIQRRGYRDGIEGARKDFGNNRQPDVNNRDEYRNPDLPPELREQYREGFRRGYQVAMSHLMGQSQGPMGPPPPVYREERGGWDVPPQELSDIQRRGYRDGIEGARKDFGNNRQPDVNNRDEYRNPDLPPELREQYREGFRRGYQMAMSHLMGQPQGPVGPPPPVYGQQEGGWDVPPQEFQAIQRQGFQDGIEGARKDFGNHRQPDVNNRDEYRNPHLPPEQREAYREGFRRGYERAISHLMGEPERR